MTLATAVVALPSVVEVGFIVFELGPERMAYYRDLLGHDTVTRNLVWFMQYCIDGAFGQSPEQLATRGRLSDSFQSAAQNARLGQGLGAERIDLASEGAITPKHNERDVRHDTSTTHHSKDHEGGHLLPRI